MTMNLTPRATIFSALSVTIGLTWSLAAQVKTEVPPVIPGAKPVTVERIKSTGPLWKGTWRGMTSTAK